MSQSLAARTADEEDVDAQAHLSIGTKLLWDSRAEHRPLDGSPRTPLLSTPERRRTLQRAIKHVTIAAEDYAKDPHGRPDQASALIQKYDDSPAYVSAKSRAHVFCGRARCLAEVSELPRASRQSKKAASRALSAVQKLLPPAGDTGEALSDGGWDDVPANAIADLR